MWSMRPNSTGGESTRRGPLGGVGRAGRRRVAVEALGSGQARGARLELADHGALDDLRLGDVGRALEETLAVRLHELLDVVALDDLLREQALGERVQQRA